MNPAGVPKNGALASKAQILAMATPKFFKAVEDAKLVGGEVHITVARALNELGEHCLSVCTVEDLNEAKKAFEASMKIQCELGGGKFSKGVYVWPDGYAPEEFVDTHYKLGLVLGAQASVSGESERSRSHQQKTLGLRETYDKHMVDVEGQEKLRKHQLLMAGRPAEEEKREDRLGNVSSPFDSTLVYSDSAEEARLNGDYKESAFLYLKCINLRRKKFGSSHVAISPTLVKYAEVLRMDFKYKEAKKALDEALAITMAVYGPEHAATTEALNNLGQVNRLLGNYDEAEALLIEALQLRRKLFGDYHVLTASTLNNLAELMRERGDYFQAVNYHNAAVESFMEAEGADHPGTINAKGNLGVTLRRQAKTSLERGEQLVNEAFHALQQKEYDPQHPWLVKFSMENVMAQASKLKDQGKHDESIELYDSLIAKKHVMAQLKALGGNSEHMPDAAADANNDDEVSIGAQSAGSKNSNEVSVGAQSAGSKNSNASRSPQGKKSPQQGGGRYGVTATSASTADLGGGDDASLGSANSGLSSTRKKFRKPVSQDLFVLTEGRVEGMISKAKHLLFKGQFGEADSVLNSALTHSWAVLGQESYLLYRGTLLQAEVKIMLAQYELSNELLVDMLQRWTDLKGPDHVEVAYAAALLAYLYYIQGMYDASHLLYLQVAEIVGSKLTLDPLATKRTGSEHNVLYCTVLIGMAKVNFKMGRFEEVLAALGQAKQLLDSSIALESPLQIELRIVYGHLRAFAGEYAGARRLYMQCLERAVVLFGSKTHAMVAYLLHKVGSMERELGNLAKSSAYLEEALYSRLKIFKDDHPDVAATELVKGTMLISLGRYDEALVLVERAMLTQRIHLGPRHPAVARSLLSLAEIYNKKGLPRDATENVVLALDINREVFGRLEGRANGDSLAEGDNAVAPHPVVVTTLIHQAINDTLCGKLMKSQMTLINVISELEMIFAALREVTGDGPDEQAESFAVPHHMLLATAQHELGRVHMLQCNADASMQMLTEAGMTTSACCGDASMCTANVLMTLGDASRAAGLFRDAQMQYSRAAVIYTSEQGPKHPVVQFELALRAISNIAHVGYLVTARTEVDSLIAAYGKASQFPTDSALFAELLHLKAQILIDYGFAKEDLKPVEEAAELLKRAIAMIKETVGVDSFQHVKSLLLHCRCQIKLSSIDKNSIDLTDAQLKLCVSIARKSVEGAENINTGPALNYRDKHPILGDVAVMRALLANPTMKPGKLNVEALRLMEKEAVPLYLAKYGEENIYFFYFSGLLGVFQNLEKRGTGNDPLRRALKAMEEAPVAYNQLFFTNDSPWVAALGGYETARLKSLGAFSEKMAVMKPYADWAIPGAAGATSDESAASAGGSHIGSDAGVLIEGVGKGPAYPECPPEDTIILSDAPRSHAWGQVAANSGLPVAKKTDKKLKVNKNPNKDIGDGILAVAIFDGGAPIHMAVKNMFGTASGGNGGGNEAQALAIRKAEILAEQAAPDAILPIKSKVPKEKQYDDDGISLTPSLSIADDGFNIAAELDALRQEKEEETGQLEKLRNSRKEEEEAMLAVKAQREAEEEAIINMKGELQKFQEQMEDFKKQHAEEMEKVKLEMLAAQKAAVAAVVVHGEGDGLEATTVMLDEGQSEEPSAAVELAAVAADVESAVGEVSAVEAESAPPADSSSGSVQFDARNEDGATLVSNGAAVAIALADDEEIAKGAKPAEGGESPPSIAAVEAKQAPIVVQSTDAASAAKAKTALDAAHFLFDRALDFRAKGWYAKSRPILAECLSIRETYKNECNNMGFNALVLCTETKFHVACNLMDMCLWSEAIQPLEECFRVRKEAAVAEGGGSNGLGNGKSRELAEVLEAQARNFHLLSMYTEANQKFIDAVKMRTDTSNPGAPENGRCICAHSLNMTAQGKFLEAKATAEKGHAILTKAYGTKNVVTGEGFLARVKILSVMGKYKDANSLLQQCVSIRRRLLDGSHPLLADAFLETAKLLAAQDRYPEADKWLSDAIDMYLIYFGEDDIRVSDARFLQAKLLCIYGKYHEAIRLHTKVYEFRKAFIIIPAKQEKPKPPTEEEIKRAAAKKKIEDEWDEEIDGPRPIVKKVEEPVAIAIKNCGEHALISQSLQELCCCYMLLGDIYKGNNYGKAAQKMCKIVYADCMINPPLAEALYWRGEGYRRLGDVERARQCHDDALDLRKRALGKDHLLFGISQSALADILCNRGLYDEAEALYRKALKLMRATVSETDSLDLADTLNSYSECLRMRGNYDLAVENNDAAMSIRKMQLNELNPSHISILECAVNRSLIELDKLIPPPGIPEAAMPLGGSLADDDDESGINFPGEASIGGDEESAAQSKAPSLHTKGEKPGFEVGIESARSAWPRDKDGVLIFQNQEYTRIRGIMRAGLDSLLASFIAEELLAGPPPGSKTGSSSPEESARKRALTNQASHPLSINLAGNLAVVDKMEAEAKMRFLFSISKDDKKLFEAAEKRALLETPSDEEARALAEAQGGDDDDNKSVGAGSVGGGSVASDNRSTTSQAAVPDDEKLPQYMFDLDKVLSQLVMLGILTTHPWHRKFTTHRLIIEKPPDEMAVAQISFKEAEKFKRQGLYTNAEAKYDEAITLQIEHLGHLAAGNSLPVAIGVYSKANNARVQCKFTQAKQLYMQCFAIYLKIDGLDGEDLANMNEDVTVAATAASASLAGSSSSVTRNQGNATAFAENASSEIVLSEGCAKSYYGIAEIYREQGQAEIAQIMHEKVFAMRTRLHIIRGKFLSKGKAAYRNHPSIIQSMMALGRLALERGDVSDAKEHAENALKMCVELGRSVAACYFVDDYSNICDIKLLLGKIYQAEGNYAKAEEHILSAQEIRFDALAPLWAVPASGALPGSSESVDDNVVKPKNDDHPDCSFDYCALAELYLAMQKLVEAKKLIGKAMRLRLKYFGRLKQNSGKLNLNSKQFLENILESQSYPEIDMIEKRLITQAGTTAGGVADQVTDAFARDPAASNDYDLASVLDDGSLGGGSVANELADAQYAASHAVVTKALELRLGLDGERLPAFVYRNIPVSNHSQIANVLAMRAEISLAMGDIEEARLMCESALNIRKDLMGRKSLATGQSLYQYACINQLSGTLSEAMSLHIVAADIKLQFLPDMERHPDMIDSMVSIGALKVLLSSLDEGHIKLQEAVEISIAMFGREHVRTADAWVAHSEYYRTIAEYSKASQLIQRALKVYKDVLPEYHGKIGLALTQEARLQMTLGLLDIAFPLVEQALNHFTMVFSEKHYHTVSALQVKCDILMRRGKVLEAKGMVESCLTARRDLFGKQNWQTAHSLLFLADNLFGLGRYATAQPIYERAVQLLRRALGLENLIVAGAMSALADCYLQTAEYDKAKSMHDSAHQIRLRLTTHRKSAKPTAEEIEKANMHPELADSLACIAELQLIYGNFELALQGFDDALAMRRATLGHMHPAVASSMHALGTCYFAQGLFSEAKQIFERALKMRKTVLPADHFHIVDTQLCIAQVYQTQGKLEQASAMFERCLVNQRISRGSRHPAVGRALFCLGDVSNQLGNYDLARSYFLDSLVIRKAAFGVSIQVAPEKEKTIPGAKAKKKDAKKEELLPSPKLDKFHPEIAESLYGLAETFRYKGLLAKPEANHMSSKGAEQLKNETGLITKQDLVEMEKARLAALRYEAGSGTSSLPGASQLLGEPSLELSVSTPGKHDYEPDDKSVVSVGLLQIETQFKRLDAELAAGGDFDDTSTIGDASHMGLNDYAGPQDSPIKSSPIKAEFRIENSEHKSIDEDEEQEFAMPLYERCLDMMLTIFGNEHPRVFVVQQAIASALQGLGNLMLSHDLFQHVLSHRRRQLGDEHVHTCESFCGVADILRAMSHIYPTNNAAAAEKRASVSKVKIVKGIGPSLTEYLASILGFDERLKNQWPPEVTHDLTLIAAGRGKVVMHPLLQKKGPKLNPNKYLGGFMGYQFPATKKLQRDRRHVESNVARPTISFLTDAKWLYDQGLASCKTSFGGDAELPLVAQLMFGKAELMRARKEMDEAMALYESALNMRRHILKGTHPAIADCLVGMAETLRYENKFTKAEPLLIKAIQIRQNAYAGGDSHPSIPEGQCSLAMLYYSMGRYLEAQPLYSESLRTRERLLGKSHIATAQSLNNYAGLLHTTGKFERALPYYRRALEIKIEALGEEHPDVASAKNNLGLLLKAMAKYPEAKELYDEALGILRKVFGELHADVAATLNNLAALHVSTGDTQKGKDLYRESLHIKKKVLGIEHTAVAASLNNLAGLCFSCGDIDDAKDYYEESLRIRRSAYGDDHPTVAESMNNIGLMLFAQGDYTNSKPLFERAIKIKSDSFGADHVSTASSQHNLAILLHKLKRFAEAEEMYSKALDVRTEVLGPEHPDTKSTKESMNVLNLDKERFGAKLNRLAASASAPQPGTGTPAGRLVDNALTQDSPYLIGSGAVRVRTPKKAYEGSQESQAENASVLSQGDQDDLDI